MDGWILFIQSSAIAWVTGWDSELSLILHYLIKWLLCPEKVDSSSSLKQKKISTSHVKWLQTREASDKCSVQIQQFRASSDIRLLFFLHSYGTFSIYVAMIHVKLGRFKWNQFEQTHPSKTTQNQMWCQLKGNWQFGHKRNLRSDCVESMYMSSLSFTEMRKWAGAKKKAGLTRMSVTQEQRSE